MNTPTSPIMRYFGGKFRMAEWIISHFPKHTTYVEPFGGAASILLQKPRSYAEVYNDMDNQIVTVFRVFQDQQKALELERLIKLTPYSRKEFEKAFTKNESDNDIEIARKVLIRSMMGFGSSGATKGATGFRCDSKRHYSLVAHLWKDYPQKIQMFTDRLQGIIIENRPAVDIINQHDGKDVLHYLDPPYVFGTRVMGGNKYYRHEMTDEQHIELLDLITGTELKGMVIISGYESELYSEYLSSWKQYRKNARTSAFRGTKVKTECLWISPKALEKAPQMDLIA